MDIVELIMQEFTERKVENKEKPLIKKFSNAAENLYHSLNNEQIETFRDYETNIYEHFLHGKRNFGRICFEII